MEVDRIEGVWELQGWDEIICYCLVSSITLFQFGYRKRRALLKSGLFIRALTSKQSVGDMMLSRT